MGFFYSILTKLAEAALLLPFLLFPWRAAWADGLVFQSGEGEFIYGPAMIVLALIFLGRTLRKKRLQR